MKAGFIFLFAASVAASSAASIVDVPKCAQNCLNKVAPKAHCSAQDYKCLCTKMSKIKKPVASCVISNCELPDLINAMSLEQKLCGPTDSKKSSTLVKENSSGEI
ncbi:hypothetical protein BGZ63DRAFT_434192 [Mariannaea sp. PMI_226]|nr:hypothetical protein BGZ63DRAFT_434192 [Mariannaea sp. PMI_226]